MPKQTQFRSCRCDAEGPRPDRSSDVLPNECGCSRQNLAHNATSLRACRKSTSALRKELCCDARSLGESVRGRPLNPTTATSVCASLRPVCVTTWGVISLAEDQARRVHCSRRRLRRLRPHSSHALQHVATLETALAVHHRSVRAGPGLRVCACRGSGSAIWVGHRRVRVGMAVVVAA